MIYFLTISAKYHNHDGELPIRPPPISPLVPEFLEAMKWAGVKKGDMNAPYYTGKLERLHLSFVYLYIYIKCHVCL